MRLKVKKIEFESGNMTDIVLNKKDAAKLGQKAGERVIIKNVKLESLSKKYWVAIVQIAHSDSIVAPGELGIFVDTLRDIKRLEEGDEVSVKAAEAPDSYKFIQKKVKGNKLNDEEINEIVEDAVSGLLSKIELASFITGISINGMDNQEMTALTMAEARSGQRFDFGPDVYDKHSTGGVPGNKVSLIIVPIVAAAGLTIPKTSTRAITSPSGTADSMEVLAPVTFSSEDAKSIISKENACIIWGGALDISPADNVLIEVERPLHFDPVGLMIPSILAKKLSMGVKKLILDIPVGKGTKFLNPEIGKAFAHKFKEIASRVGVHAECALTLAHQPIGHSIGPAIEAKEAIFLLKDYTAGPNSLIEKSTSLAGMILEMSGKAQRGKGQGLAKELLKSGKAYEKMKRIIEIQGGNPEIQPEDITLGQFKRDFYSTKSGHITQVDNSIINQIAKAAGCPYSKESGVEIYKKQGAKVEEKEKIFTIYSNSRNKLKRAEKIYNSTGGPIILGGMVIERV
ncbi:MAG: AMP phosphorylase [Candidatus Lokiarchaeota archaeon]|nr:AMP phosphorylase [Candidatus Lokiarchaeota archaeon]MBD3202302.1 AMP phosphorylase [Candidatus Lokiarchaeota archaeon]